jgi:hypothetical protein
MKQRRIVLIVLLLLSGCASIGPQGSADSAAPAPTIVFEPTDSSYLLACVNELQGLKRKDFNHYYKAAIKNLDQGNDRDTLKFICLSLHPRASYSQFVRGRKTLGRYIAEHPDAEGDMQGLETLISRLDRSMQSRSSGRKKLQEERDELEARVASQQLEISQDKGRIQELQRQIDQLKNIENIIKNREH